MSEEQENKYFAIAHLSCALAYMSNESAKGIIDILTGHAWDQAEAIKIKDALQFL